MYPSTGFKLPKRLDTRNTQTLNRLLTALAQAENYLNSNLIQAQQIMKAQFNYTDSYITTIWSRTTFSLILPHRLPQIMQQQATWMINNNITNQTTSPTAASYIDTTALKAAKSDAVTIPKFFFFKGKNNFSFIDLNCSK